MYSCYDFVERILDKLTYLYWRILDKLTIVFSPKMWKFIVFFLDFGLH